MGKMRGWIFCIVFLSLSAVVFCHPPQDVRLNYNPETRDLAIAVVHQVKDVQNHYIAQIEITVNNEQPIEKTYTQQTSLEKQEDTIKMEKVKPGDNIKVKATCKIFGSKTFTMVIPEKAPKDVKEEKKMTPVKEEQLPSKPAKPEEGDAKMLKIGDKAPEFSLKDQDGNLVELKSFLGKKNVVLVFYPGDNTPGCTKQMCAIRDDYSQFSAADAVAFGINPQDKDSHKKFVEKNKLPFPLLVDADKKVVTAYGTKGVLMTTRTVYGIDKKGIIVFAQRGMPSNQEILKAFTKEKEQGKPPEQGKESGKNPEKKTKEKDSAK